MSQPLSYEGLAPVDGAEEARGSHPGQSTVLHLSPRTRRLLRVRQWLHRQLDPRASQVGLSALNTVLCVLIVLAALLAIIETEPSISDGREGFFRAAEMGLGVVFAIEYVARLWAAGERPGHRGPWRARLAYALTPAALTDLVAIVPSLFAVTTLPTYALRLVRLMRIMRLAKLGRLSSAWDLIREVLRDRRYELLLTLAIGAILLTFAAVALYMIEGPGQPEQFGSVPRALWWGVVTLTTIGYGDVYPVTALGRVVASLVAVAGIGVVAAPTGILAAGFSDALQRRRAAKEHHAPGSVQSA